MIDIIFYKTTDLFNKINKTLSEEVILQGTIKDETGILEPSIKIKYNENILSKNINYFYIPILGRYYFITGKTIDDVFLIIDGSVDVLMSYKDDILNSTQIITRQESAFNLDLVDEEVVITNKMKHQILNFPNSPFNTNSTIPSDGFYYTMTTGSLQSNI